MTWKYALTKDCGYRGMDGSPQARYCVREVYFTDGGEVCNWSSDPISLHGESAKDVVEDLQKMLQGVSDGLVLDLTVDLPVWIDAP